VPLVGDRIAETAAPVREAGDNARRSALQSRQAAHDLSWLLGVAIALLPTLPVLGLYLPARVALVRDRRAIARAVRDGSDAGLEETLARRAVVNLPFHRLREVSAAPLDDLARGRHGALARAELRRLGLDQGSIRPRRIA
jgi:hypothetical protein